MSELTASFLECRRRLLNSQRVTTTGSAEKLQAGQLMGIPESASLEDAATIARECCADEIVLALPWSDTRKIELVRDRLQASPLPIALLPDRRIRSLLENPSFKTKKSLPIEVLRGSRTRLEQFSKCRIDIAGAAIALMALSPLMLLSAAAIKHHPRCYGVSRNGFNT